MMKEKKRKKNWLKSWIDGDVLLSPFWNRQMGLVLLVSALIIVYVSNRYAFQQEQVQIQKLREKLDDGLICLGDIRLMKEISTPASRS
jgi:hypothetical protein